MDRTERFYRIQGLLEARKFVPVNVFLEELGVSLATFKRDLEYLRSRMNAPIDWDPRRRGYRLGEAAAGTPRYSLPGLWLPPAEIHALLLLEELLAQIQPGLLGGHLKPLRDRLEALLGGGQGAAAELRRRIRILRMPSRPVDSKHFQTVSTATLSRRRLRLAYYSRSNDEQTCREVSPQRLVSYRGNWYLDSWCHLRRGLRSFAVDAIREAELLETPADEVSEAELDAHLGAGYGIYAGPAKATALLRFTPAAARWVAREVWHPLQTQRHDESGFLLLEVPYSHEQELAMDVLRYAGDVEVLGPPSLRAKVQAALAGALEKYRSAASESRRA